MSVDFEFYRNESDPGRSRVSATLGSVVGLSVLTHDAQFVNQMLITINKRVCEECRFVSQSRYFCTGCDTKTLG